MIEIVQLPVLQDNYLYLIHEPTSGETAIVDPAVDAPVIDACEARGWRLTHIFNTHHHWDHTGANLALKDHYGLHITGPKAEAERIPGIDRPVSEGDVVMLGAVKAAVFDVPGHTSGHIAYHFADDRALFCGDTLFAMGCGRLFEGTPAQMWASLQKLMVLDGDTSVYCAHEYTTTNGKFALSVEPDNPDLITRMDEVKALRAEGKPTIPTTIALEKRTNPFLRPDSPGLQASLDMVGADPVAVFAETRQRKDNF